MPTPDPIAFAPPTARAERALALAWGVMVTLCVTGYTFGQSNHHVYLLDALRIQQPETLAHDWFTTHTLQYHFLFTRLVLGLQRVRLLEAGFFTLYLALAAALHAAWLSIVARVGGDLRAYLLSVLIYHLSGGGLGLGVYQFLQDGSFLPSNISAVATLAALALWLDRRLLPAAACVGVAGLFHVNYALVLIGFWVTLSLASARARRPDGLALLRYAAATLVAMSPCLFNVTLAAVGALRQTSKVPLDEFVALYVRLRHEHHHDPLHWPLALWLSFLWPIPLALFAARRLPRTLAVRRLNLVLCLVLAMELFAFTFAGVWFVSDRIVQMSLFRFSIFAKLITCAYAAWLLLRWRGGRPVAVACAVAGAALLIALAFRDRLPASIPRPHVGFFVGAATLAAMLAAHLAVPIPRRWRVAAVGIALPVCVVFAARQQLGVAMPGEGDADMRAVADWARANTPPGALFLTPPHDASFSLDARRSTVVGFKQVPQLSGELVEWKRRLDAVLDMDILCLPVPMQRTLDAMAARYAALPAAHLTGVARRYGCDHVVAMRTFAAAAAVTPEYVSPGGRYAVYAVPAVASLDNAGGPSTLPARDVRPASGD